MTPKEGIKGEPANGLPMSKLSLVFLSPADTTAALGILGIFFGGGRSGNYSFYIFSSYLS